ncbi:MAG TPA: nitroreductase family deazaflavin-dependent oxidoreductase [Candidatus Limnocylindrales bacterium]|jgi:deazaflavin-dependent oxidoreductase (nitroreductase family)
MAPADDVGEQLASWGKVARIETRGRASGRRVVTAVGFVEEADGAVLVAAGSPEADWARNLDAEPACRLEIEDRSTDRRAERLDGADASRAIVALILKYGTPAERLGHGPAFRLRGSSGGRSSGTQTGR